MCAYLDAALFYLVIVLAALACPGPLGHCGVMPVPETVCDDDGKRECKRNVWYDIGERCAWWIEWYPADDAEYPVVYTTEWKCRTGRALWLRPFTGDACPAGYKTLVAIPHDAVEERWGWKEDRVDITFNMSRVCRAPCPFGSGYDWVGDRDRGKEGAEQAKRQLAKVMSGHLGDKV